tara:strand:+ start:15761 stop:16318 length:558 start_codon:yes stop_codon:yes gene_type:complete
MSLIGPAGSPDPEDVTQTAFSKFAALKDPDPEKKAGQYERWRDRTAQRQSKTTAITRRCASCYSFLWPLCSACNLRHLWYCSTFPGSGCSSPFSQNANQSTLPCLEAKRSAGCDNVAGDYQTRVDIRLQPLDGDATLLSISESGWRDNDAARAGSYSNCSGWMHMACCLKAYLEYGINLRAGGVI